MKKILAVILALAMLLSLSACTLSDLITTASSIISGGVSADTITVDDLNSVSGNDDIFESAVIISTDALIMVTVNYDYPYSSGAWNASSNVTTIGYGQLTYGTGSFTITVTDSDYIYSIQNNGLIIGIGSSFSGTIPAKYFN